jgi:tetratricopeptide (TPR) repeat protein
MSAKLIKEAERVFHNAALRFPDDVDVAAAYAGAAENIPDWATAQSRWQSVQERFPASHVGHLGFGRTLRESGQLSRAAEVLRESLQRFPNHWLFEIELAFTLSAQRRWPEALELWASLRVRFPQDNNVRSNITWILGQAVADQNAHGAPAFEIPQVLLDPATEDDPRLAHVQLLKRFESLGDTCEFGMVQRLYHVEQMSLLRWARTTPDKLIEALATRFAGVGEEQYTIIEVNEGEYVTQDTRYFMHSHTFTSPAAEPLEVFAPEQRRRMQWLRRKLIENLTAASKIFIYRYEDGITDADVTALHAALLDYSPHNKLLCVRLVDAAHPVGAVDRLADGLFVGYIDRFSTVNINVDAWLTLCGAVADQLDAAPTLG